MSVLGHLSRALGHTVAGPLGNHPGARTAAMRARRTVGVLLLVADELVVAILGELVPAFE